MSASPMQALLLVHQGSRMTAALTAALREKGYEPFVLSSATFDDEDFHRRCDELGVQRKVCPSVSLTTDEVLEQVRAMPDVRLCWTVWEGARVEAAQANQAIGAHDADPEAILLAQDKHLMRRRLVELGLSSLRPLRLTDPELRERLDRGEKHIVKPRRGGGSLCTRAVTSWDEVTAQLASFERGPADEDLMAEFFVDNELIAETFFEGRMLSFEVLRQGGRTLYASDHERTVMDFLPETVLERGFASPPVNITAAEVQAAREHSDRVLGGLGLDDGAYHMELAVDSTGRCEIIEVNPRVGGQYMYDSVRLQLGRSLAYDWIDVMAGVPLEPAGERTCGTYYQAHYLEAGRQVLGMDKRTDLPEPVMFAQTYEPGMTARADREELGAMSIWTTDLATHRETVAKLWPQEYATFVYAKGLTGRPLFLVLEPTNHVFQVVEAADRLGYDVLVFHTLPQPSSGPYAGSRTSMAATYLVDSWTDLDACMALVLEVVGDRPVAGSYAAQELTLELDARLQEHFGLPGKGTAVIRELLDKVKVRRRLAAAGLTELRIFEQEEATALQSWPIGDRALYFKPVHGAASAFVKRCRDLDEVRAAIEAWDAADIASLPVLGAYLESDGGRFFLEEEAVGELMSVEGYVHHGTYHLLGLTSRAVLERDVAVEMGITYPYQHPRRDDIVTAVARLHEALGVTHGATHTEIIVPAQGRIELVELNARFTGADALSAMNAAYDAKIEDDLVALAVGTEPNFSLQPKRFASLHFLLAPTGVTRIESFELPEANLPFVKIIRPPGSVLTSTDRQIDWIAAFIVCGDSCEQAYERALDVRRRTLVNGVPLGDDPNNVVIGH